MIEEQEFRAHCDQAFADLYKSLGGLAEEHDFEADLSNGTVTVEFEEPPSKFVVSPQAPLRQVWVSAHSRSFKLDWSAERGEFFLPATGQSLKELIAEHVSENVGEKVAL